MNFFSEYGLFLAQTVTWVFAILIILVGLFAIINKSKTTTKEKLRIKKINDKYRAMEKTLNTEILSKSELKAFAKARKSKKKKEGKKRNIFIIQFKGNIKASAVESLRNEVTAVLTVAKPEDEVLINLESAGGLVHAYGLAASQLQRIKDRNIPLTVCVDKVAASGGYLMACVADKILAAPFAVIGSIGVVAQIPNFYKLLKKNNVDFELLTAGEYKRTLTVFGENTNEARKKFQQDLEDIHVIFKDFITEHRPQLDINKVSTGEHWLARKAFELNLVDKLITSDDYLLGRKETANLYEVSYKSKKTLGEKVISSIEMLVQKLYDNIRQEEQLY